MQVECQSGRRQPDAARNLLAGWKYDGYRLVDAGGRTSTGPAFRRFTNRTVRRL